MKLFVILAVLALSVAVFGQATICNLPATGPQQYSLSGTGVPQHIPGALNEVLGDIPQAYIALPGMPASPLAFCGPAWQPNYPYVLGNLIEPIPGGTVFQAVGYFGCVSGCTSGSTQPAQFAQFVGTTYEPSPVIGWVTTCTDSGTTATCATVDAVGESVGINQLEPYEGADVGGTMRITDYPNSAYNGTWVVTASTNSKPYTFSFAASGLGSGDCTQIGGAPTCTTYQQGSQIIDHQILWQDVGPQNEIALLTPTVTVTPAASSITTAQSLSATVAVSGGSGNPTPTGTVTLTSGNYTSAATTLSVGTATINIPACSLAAGTDTLTATYSGDGNYSTATGTNSVTVTQAPCFTVAGTPASVSVSPGATTGNTSTITVTSVDGFAGSVNLTAAVTSGPAGAQDLPTFSFSPASSVNISPGTTGMATLTISTTAPTGAALADPVSPGTRWYTAGGRALAAFALLLGMGIPAQRRSWYTRLGLLVFLATLIGALLACGSSGSAAGGSRGTTPGKYKVTVTGTSGSTTATATVTLTVQ